MSDFKFLFTAWMAVWAIFLIYEFTIARRMSQLKDDLARLKQQMKDPSR